MHTEDNENRYAKWLNNELSDAELEALKASEDFPILEKIVAEVDTWQVPKVKASYSNFKAKLAAKEQATKRKRLYRLSFSIAASIVLLIVAFVVIYSQYFNTITYQTLAGQKQEITLPDGSQVTMNGASSLSFQDFNWLSNRKVNFEGQAFFDIRQSGDFEVSLPTGSIQVLGTKFDVLAKEEALNIKCFEGEVLVNYQSEQVRLPKGKGLRVASPSSSEQFDLSEEGDQPSWMGSSYTKFTNAPLQEVLEALSMNYGLEFTAVMDKHQKLRFTGQFANNDVDLALQMVLETLGVDYVKEGNVLRLK